MDSNGSGITRASILNPIFKKFGKAGYSVTKIWTSFCPNQNIDYDPDKCNKLKNLSLSVMRKWKKAD